MSIILWCLLLARLFILDSPSIKNLRRDIIILCNFGYNVSKYSRGLVLFLLFQNNNISSSAYSQNEAQNKWATIQQKHKKILQGANLVVKRVEGKNEQIFFLVMAGSYPSLGHAKLVCKKLSRRKQNCIVTK